MSVKRRARDGCAFETRTVLAILDELADDDPARLRCDPEDQGVGGLIGIPLFDVVPKWIGILAGVEGVAEQGTEAGPIKLFALIVIEAPGPIKHEQGRI